VVNELQLGLNSDLKRRGIGGEFLKFGVLRRHHLELELVLRSLLGACFRRCTSASH
jgi:hypothetical protein